MDWSCQTKSEIEKITERKEGSKLKTILSLGAIRIFERNREVVIVVCG